MYGAIIARTVIVLVVFPVVGHAIFSATTFLLDFVLPAVLGLADSWSDVLDKAVVGATLLLAVGASFKVCRRLWPTSLVK